MAAARRRLSGLNATLKTFPLTPPTKVDRGTGSAPGSAARSQTCTASFELPVASHLPSGLKATLQASGKTRRRRPDAASQTRTLSDGLALASCRPSGLNTTAVTTFLWPRRVRVGAPVTASQRITSPGRIPPAPAVSQNGFPPPADASLLPSGLY